MSAFATLERQFERQRETEAMSRFELAAAQEAATAARQEDARVLVRDAESLKELWYSTENDLIFQLLAASMKSKHDNEAIKALKQQLIEEMARAIESGWLSK